MKKVITFLFLLVIITACSNSKTKPKISDELKSISLEKFLAQNKNYIKIPLDKMTSGHLHLNAYINGVKGNFILDTGAGATVIDPKTQGKFNIRSQKSEISGIGVGGQTNVKESLNNSFKIGSLVLPKYQLYIISLDHVNNALISLGLNEVDGMIGADILVSNKGIIDYSNLTLYLKK